MTQTFIDDYRQLFLRDTAMIDVRAPVEFQKGAFPTATNLPLMTDQERHLVGVEYKEQGQQAAIALGEKLVTPVLRQQRTNAWRDYVAQHPEGCLYCFRGGLRSRISQSWLQECGINYPLVHGGYKAMRRFLMEQLELNTANSKMVIIHGRTGVGKTRLLQQLSNMLDLEGLARHRGSSFGNLSISQPSVINFENSLSIALLKLHQNPEQTIFLEGEGRLIGRLGLPSVLLEKMRRSPYLILEADIKERIRYGIEDYVNELLEELLQRYNFPDAVEMLGDRHKQSLWHIRKRLGGGRYQLASRLL